MGNAPKLYLLILNPFDSVSVWVNVRKVVFSIKVKHLTVKITKG